MKILKPVALIALIFGLLLSSVRSYKYLAVLHTVARSHYIVGSSLLKGLAAKGHEVTVISPISVNKRIENYNEIITPQIMKAMQGRMDTLFDSINRSIMVNLVDYFDMGIDITRKILEEDSVKELLKSNQTFDAVICEVFLSEALFGLSEHFNAPLIGLGTFGAISWNTDMVGSPSPPSYVPNALLPLSDRMSLPQRLGNMAFLIFEKIFMELSYLPRQEALYKEFFPNAKRTLDEIKRNTALVLLNTHVSLNFARPYVPNQIEVGGMHVNRKRSPLPENIRNFIEGAKHGVIYFSMGSNLKSKQLPLEKRQIILDTFRSLKQRVLWKFEDTTLEGKPDNVMISDWFPQDDILAHDNVKLFITHGGLLSTIETIYYGKPIVGIPIFGDQFLNMARAEINGFGISCDYKTFNLPDFKGAILRILENPSYSKLVRSMSQRFKDQPDLPLDRAIYWVEHVVRHKGAEYLHCSGQDLNFIQYHSIDTLSILVGIVLLIVYIIQKLIRFVLCKLYRLVFGGACSRKNSKKVKKN